MKRNKWINEKVYNHLGEEVKLPNDYFIDSEYYWGGMEHLGSYLDLKYYEFMTLSERLVMCKVAMMYAGRRVFYDDGLEYLIGYKDKLDTPEIRKCKSWKSLCNKVQYIMLGHTEFIDEKSVLINLIIKFIYREFIDCRNKGCQDSRNDMILALRLYYISGYDRSRLYEAINTVDLPYNSDNIKDSLICTLKLLKVWKHSYLYHMMYETTRILMVESMKQSLILKVSNNV